MTGRVRPCAPQCAPLRARCRECALRRAPIEAHGRTHAERSRVVRECALPADGAPNRDAHAPRRTRPRVPTDLPPGDWLFANQRDVDVISGGGDRLTARQEGTSQERATAEDSEPLGAALGAAWCKP